MRSLQDLPRNRIDAKDDRKFDPGSFRASGRRRWFAAHLAPPGISPAGYRACARLQAMRIRPKGRHSEPHGATRAVRGVSAAARVTRSALRDVGDRVTGDGDGRGLRPVGRLRGAGPRAAGPFATRAVAIPPHVAHLVLVAIGDVSTEQPQPLGAESPRQAALRAPPAAQ